MRKTPIDNQPVSDGDDAIKLALPFEDFLRQLKGKGFQVGLDNYLRVQAILNQLEPGCKMERVKQLIGPIFCTTQEEQVLFAALFDDYFKTHLPKIVVEGSLAKIPNTSFESKLTKEIKSKKDTEKSKRRKWIFYLILAGIGITIVSNLLADFIIPTAVDAPQNSDSFFADINWGSVWLRALFIVLLSFILIGIFAYQIFIKNKREENKRLGLDSQRLRKPMLHWKIDIPKVSLPLFSNAAFYNATRLLKSRERSESRFLDVPKTISASISNMGFPKLSYSFRTKFPEYLILIDKASFRDHQAIYFEQLYQSLEAQEIFAVRYYYRHQPNKCWDENDKGIDLETLFKKYHSHRLIIMGDLLDLFDPMSGKLNEVVHPILLWKHKAVLTTQRASKRIVNELNNYSNFVVLKASVDNLLSLQDAMTLSGTGNQIDDGVARRLNSALEHMSEDQVIKNLQKNLDKITFQWLSVCAVYPELNWPFTLYLGKEVFGEEALTENRILDLVQLPWYREGLIPEKLRSRLIRALPPEVLSKARVVILNWLKENPPQVDDEQTKNDYELYIAMEASMLDEESVEKKKWLQSQIRKPAQKDSRYREIVLQYLDGKTSKETAFALPGWAQGLFGLRGKVDEFAISLEKEAGEYIYPKVKLIDRFLAKVIDWTLYAYVILFCFFLSSIIGSAIVLYVRGSYELTLQNVLMYLFLYLIYELIVRFEGSYVGFGKRSMGLICINIKTNAKTGRQKSRWRYSNFLIYIVTFIFLVESNYDTLLLNVVEVTTVCYLFLKVILATTNGRVPFDYVAETQVVYLQDYKSENYKGNTDYIEKEQTIYPKKDVYIYPKAVGYKRIVAKLIDWSLLGIILVVAEFLIIFPGRGEIGESLVYLIISTMFLYSVYLLMVIFEGVLRGVGKRIMGLVIVNTRTNKPLSVKQIFIRYLDLIFYYLLIAMFMVILVRVFPTLETNVALLIAGILISLFIAINVISIFTKSGRLFIDRMAHSQVVNREDYLAGNFINVEQQNKPEVLKPEPQVQSTSQSEPQSNLEPPSQSAALSQSNIGEEAFEFYSEEALRQRFEQLEVKPFDHCLLIFKTSKQQTWLISRGNKLFCFLDSKKTRNSGKLIQWSYLLESNNPAELYIKTKRKTNSTRTGLLDVGNRRNWLYTLALHPNAKQFAADIRSLFPTEKVEGLSIELDPSGSLKGEGPQNIQSQSAINIPERMKGMVDDVQQKFENVKSNEPKRLFISYASKDYDSYQELRSWLKPLENDGQIIIKENFAIALEKAMVNEINELSKIDFILMLISPRYLYSNFLMNKEIPLIKQKYFNGEFPNVLPIIIRPCHWESFKVFNDFTFINEEPLSTRENPRMAFTEIVNYIKSKIEGKEPPLLETRPQTQSQTQEQGFIYEIGVLMRNGQFEKAMELGIEYASKNSFEELRNSLLMIQSRFENNKKLKIDGKLSREEYMRVDNILRSEVIDLLNSYKNQQPPA